MAEAPSDRPIQWDTERYVIDTEATCTADDEGASDDVRVHHLFGSPALAQELFDKGPTFLVNQNVLHHYGYALGVTTHQATDEFGEERTIVDGICLFRSNDIDGIWFDESTVVVGREKLRQAGLR